MTSFPRLRVVIAQRPLRRGTAGRRRLGREEIVHLLLTSIWRSGRRAHARVGLSSLLRAASTRRTCAIDILEDSAEVIRCWALEFIQIVHIDTLRHRSKRPSGAHFFDDPLSLLSLRCLRFGRAKASHSASIWPSLTATAVTAPPPWKIAQSGNPGTQSSAVSLRRGTPEPLLYFLLLRD